MSLFRPPKKPVEFKLEKPRVTAIRKVSQVVSAVFRTRNIKVRLVS